MKGWMFRLAFCFTHRRPGRDFTRRLWQVYILKVKKSSLLRHVSVKSTKHTADTGFPPPTAAVWRDARQEVPYKVTQGGKETQQRGRWEPSQLRGNSCHRGHLFQESVSWLIQGFRHDIPNSPPVFDLLWSKFPMWLFTCAVTLHLSWLLWWLLFLPLQQEGWSFVGNKARKNSASSE